MDMAKEGKGEGSHDLLVVHQQDRGPSRVVLVVHSGQGREVPLSPGLSLSVFIPQ